MAHMHLFAVIVTFRFKASRIRARTFSMYAHVHYTNVRHTVRNLLRLKFVMYVSHFLGYLCIAQQILYIHMLTCNNTKQTGTNAVSKI